MFSRIRGDDGFDSKNVLGQNQTRQDLSGSRGNSSPETNNTGRTIWVHVTMASSAANQVITATVGGLLIVGTNAAQVGNASSISFPVLDGEEYSVTIPSFSSIISWVEVR